MSLQTLVVNFIVVFYTLFVRYYVLKKQNKDYSNLKSHFLSEPSVNYNMSRSNGETAGPDPRPSILNCATLSEPPWSTTRHLPLLRHISGPRFTLLQISTLVCTMRHRLKPCCQNINNNLTGSSEFTLKSLLPVNWQQPFHRKIAAAS